MRDFHRCGILLLLTVVPNVTPLRAQSDCAGAVLIAGDLLTTAQVALQSGAPLTAATTLEQVSTFLRASCPADDITTTASVNPPSEATSAAETTASPETTAPAVPPASSAVLHAPALDPNSDITFVRFANTSADSGAVDIYVAALGDTPLIEHLAFGEFTDFIYLPTGQHTVIVRAAGSGVAGETLSTLSWNFSEDTSWVVATAGRLDAFTFQVEPFTILRGTVNGNARVRTVNWVAGRELLTVTSAPDANFGTDLGWIGVHDAEVTPGRYTLSVTTTSGVTLIPPADYDFAADTVYSLLVVGDPDGDPVPRLLVLTSPIDTTRVRFVNNRGDTVEIFRRPGNTLIVESLAPGATSDYVTLTSGAATFVAYAPGTGTTGQELSALIGEIRPARDLTIALQADNTMTTVERGFTAR